MAWHIYFVLQSSYISSICLTNLMLHSYCFPCRALLNLSFQPKVTKIMLTASIIFINKIYRFSYTLRHMWKMYLFMLQILGINCFSNKFQTIRVYSIIVFWFFKDSLHYSRCIGQKGSLCRWNITYKFIYFQKLINWLDNIFIYFKMIDL